MYDETQINHSDREQSTYLEQEGKQRILLHSLHEDDGRTLTAARARGLTQSN